MLFNWLLDIRLFLYLRKRRLQFGALSVRYRGQSLSSDVDFGFIDITKILPVCFATAIWLSTFCV
jgi:hypothetical protein